MEGKVLFAKVSSTTQKVNLFPLGWKKDLTEKFCKIRTPQEKLILRVLWIQVPNQLILGFSTAKLQSLIMVRLDQLVVVALKSTMQMVIYILKMHLELKSLIYLISVLLVVLEQFSLVKSQTTMVAWSRLQVANTVQMTQIQVQRINRLFQKLQQNKPHLKVKLI
jgi:hypothetical protein